LQCYHLDFNPLLDLAKSIVDFIFLLVDNSNCFNQIFNYSLTVRYAFLLPTHRRGKGCRGAAAPLDDFCPPSDFFSGLISFAARCLQGQKDTPFPVRTFFFVCFRERRFFGQKDTLILVKTFFLTRISRCNQNLMP